MSLSFSYYGTLLFYSIQFVFVYFSLYFYVKASNSFVKILFFLSPACMLSYFAAIRDPSVGSDYVGYYYHMVDLLGGHFDQISSLTDGVHFEFGYSFLVLLLGMTFRDQFWVAFFIYFLIAVLWLLALRELMEKKEIPLAAFLLFSSTWLLSYNILRQMIAFSVCIYLIGLTFRFKAFSWYYYAIIGGVGALFHKVAIVSVLSLWSMLGGGGALSGWHF